MNLNKFLLAIHILASIIGLGPAFLLPLFAHSLQKGKEIQYGKISRILPFVKGGTLILLISGGALDLASGGIFIHTGWLPISIVLVLILLILVFIVSHRILKQVGLAMTNPSLDATHYQSAVLRFQRVAWLLCGLILTALYLMVAKPF